MRYLSGTPYPAALRWRHGGLMLTPEMGNRPALRGVVWAADNGCFTAGEHFSAARWLAWMDSLEEYWPWCQFAVLPDVPFNAAATWQRSRPFVDEIRGRGLRPALAIQEGIDRMEVPWPEIGAVFIAGRSQTFKRSQVARRVVMGARQRGLLAHYARGSSLLAVQAAYDMGCTSMDGTYLRFAPDHNWPILRSWFDSLCVHPRTRREVWGSDARFSRCRDCGRQLWEVSG